MTDAKTPRPAEEVAREMVPDPIMHDDRGRILAEMRYPGQTTGAVWPDFARPEEVDDLRRLLAHTITCAREEGVAAALHGVALADREHLGREVRAVWISWAREQFAPKPSWLVPWEGLAEPDREVDRRIGDRLFAMGAAAERARVVARLRRMAADSEYIPNMSAWTTAANVIESEGPIAEQPRDIAGRIRALALTWVDRWIDAEREAFSGHDRFDIGRAHARRLIVRELVRQCARGIADLRMFDALAADDSLIVDDYSTAEEELKAIVRESGER